MNKTLLQSLVFVLVCGFGSNLVYAETKDRVRNSTGAECEKSYDSGHSLSIGLEGEPELDKETGTGKVLVTWTYRFGGKSDRINCQRILSYEEQKQEIELERLRIELELLRRQLEKPDTSTADIAPQADGDDW